ncbi:FMN-dependent NADH-azoreductase [Gluconacetobacter tumulisoli]|uniref:FMN dependent NADH:quinone oxidoreductase n=1 Tax=Gluconacetobacter tumulisoli TaxID=1286189 RepID=A0A7W4K714_9PROT|nr:NAD(P)H-dependent oxidoreductase [Gluconacetobacter tumulisoli]MBB2201511.1 FMN-dependent NADH-azoreductase [Gluconacetobacter tumulisoli]
MTLLHLDASILPGDHSVSRALSAATVDHLLGLDPGLAVTYRDLVADPLPHMTPSNLPPDHPLSQPGDEAARAVSATVLEEFLAADIVVIGAPMYNFTVPGQLKAWVDRILVPGRTFSYGPDGVKGLAGGKRVVIVLSRGGFYGADTPYAAAEHVGTWLRTVLAFVGIGAPDIVVAEGVSRGDDMRAAALAAARQAIAALPAA